MSQRNLDLSLVLTCSLAVFPPSKNTASTLSSRYEGRTKLKQAWSCDVGYERFLGPEIFFNPEIFSADFIQVWCWLSLLISCWRFIQSA